MNRRDVIAGAAAFGFLSRMQATANDQTIVLPDRGATKSEADLPEFDSWSSTGRAVETTGKRLLGTFWQLQNTEGHYFGPFSILACRYDGQMAHLSVLDLRTSRHIEIRAEKQTPIGQPVTVRIFRGNEVIAEKNYTPNLDQLVYPISMECFVPPTSVELSTESDVKASNVDIRARIQSRMDAFSDLLSKFTGGQSGNPERILFVDVGGSADQRYELDRLVQQQVDVRIERFSPKGDEQKVLSFASMLTSATQSILGANFATAERLFLVERNSVVEITPDLVTATETGDSDLDAQKVYRAKSQQSSGGMGFSFFGIGANTSMSDAFSEASSDESSRARNAVRRFLGNKKSVPALSWGQIRNAMYESHAAINVDFGETVITTETIGLRLSLKRVPESPAKSLNGVLIEDLEKP